MSAMLTTVVWLRIGICGQYRVPPGILECDSVFVMDWRPRGAGAAVDEGVAVQ